MLFVAVPALGSGTEKRVLGGGLAGVVEAVEVSKMLVGSDIEDPSFEIAFTSVVPAACEGEKEKAGITVLAEAAKILSPG